MINNCVVLQALQFLSKAHRCEVQAGGWEKEPALFKEVIKKAINMAEGENIIQLFLHSNTDTWVFISENLNTGSFDTSWLYLRFIPPFDWMVVSFF